MAPKERLDVLVAERCLAESRQKAQRLILAGLVRVDGQMLDKVGSKVERTAEIQLQEPEHAYVSRGGLKLEGAFEAFGLDMQDAVLCDIGASTGGFVDCALQHGARKVYAIDVGYGQLDWSLRQDPRVESRERTNARYLTRSDFPEAMDWVTTDVAFISLEKILPVAYDILKDEGQVLALIKPQFEAGREHVGKHGVVRDPSVHLAVIERLMRIVKELGFSVLGLTHSPIRGPKGNIEYLFWLMKASGKDEELLPGVLVKTAFENFQDSEPPHA